MKNIIVGHEHIFDEHCVPDKFIGWKWLQKVVNTFTLPIVLAMKWALPLSRRDILSRYASFIQNENYSQQNNFKELKSYYPDDAEFVILTMDMSQMGAGKVEKSIEEQVKEVIEMKENGERILLFFHIDPYNSDCLALLYKYSEFIDGIKVYTLLGYFVDHPNMLQAFKWASDNQKPVVLHTSPDSPVFYKGKDIKARLSLATKLLKYTGKKNQDLCKNFTDTRYYEDMLSWFPNVNFDFAHLAGEKEVDKAIEGKESMATELLALCAQYDNAYFDTSYTFHCEKYYNYLKMIMDNNDAIAESALFGTDFYMNKTAGKNSDYYGRMIQYIGNNKFKQIARINPHKFFKRDERSNTIS